MNIQEYIKAAVRTESHPTKFLKNLNGAGSAIDIDDFTSESLNFSRLLHCSIGLCTENGELAEFFQEGKPASNLLEEVGDLLWYCAIGYDTLQADPTVPDLFNVTRDDLSISIGNIQDVLKRSLFYGKEFDEERFLLNLDRVFDFCSSILEGTEFTLEQAMEKNIAKLKARYPEKFTEDNAVNRDLEKELQALES